MVRGRDHGERTKDHRSASLGEKRRVCVGGGHEEAGGEGRSALHEGAAVQRGERAEEEELHGTKVPGNFRGTLKI